jgi:hypothetical protein
MEGGARRGKEASNARILVPGADPIAAALGIADEQEADNRQDCCGTTSRGNSDEPPPRSSKFRRLIRPISTCIDCIAVSPPRETVAQMLQIVK